MTVSSSPRLGLTRWSAGTDPFTRAQTDADHAKIDDLVALYAQGLEAAIPDPELEGRLHLSTDTGRLRYDDGANWREVVASGVYIGGDPTTSEQVAIGNTARQDVITEAVTWTGRLALSADDWTAPALYLHGNDAATDSDAVMRVVTDDVVLGSQERARVDNDGALRIGRNGSSIDPEVTRTGFLTVRPHSAAERGIVVDGATATTGDLITARTAGTRRFTVDAKGRIYLSALGDNAAPGTPGGAGVIYCNTVGDLLYKSPSGNVTQLAAH